MSSGASSWACLGNVWGHIWGIIWGMSGASFGAFLVQSKISAVLHAYLMPFLASDSQAHFRKKVKVHISSWFSPSA